MRLKAQPSQVRLSFSFSSWLQKRQEEEAGFAGKSNKHGEYGTVGLGFGVRKIHDLPAKMVRIKLVNTATSEATQFWMTAP